MTYEYLADGWPHAPKDVLRRAYDMDRSAVYTDDRRAVHGSAITAAIVGHSCTVKISGPLATDLVSDLNTNAEHFFGNI